MTSLLEFPGLNLAHLEVNDNDTTVDLGVTGTTELVSTACTFGNSLTLPLVFMSSLMPAADFDRAVGYTALFLTGWSPLLWSLGYSQLTSAGFAANASGKPCYWADSLRLHAPCATEWAGTYHSLHRRSSILDACVLSQRNSWQSCDFLQGRAWDCWLYTYQ